MPGRLLDTNAVIALQRGDPDVIRLLDDEESEWYLSATVLGELYYGAYRSSQRERNLEVVDAIARGVVVLPVDSQTAKAFGGIHQELRDKGKPIPENDIWIAATARQHLLVLVTQDKHFSTIDGLSIESWSSSEE